MADEWAKNLHEMGKPSHQQQQQQMHAQKTHSGGGGA
jgi:hypothetical protein